MAGLGGMAGLPPTPWIHHYLCIRSSPYYLYDSVYNSNGHDNVYGAVVMATFARVHPVHLMNAEQRQAAAELCTKPVGLSRRSACRQL